MYINKLYSYLDANDLIPMNQFGFLTGKSTGDALLTAVKDWFRILDRDKSNIGAVFFDLSKRLTRFLIHSFCLNLTMLSQGWPEMVR